MNCCMECFHDAQIRDMIRTNNEIGNSPFINKETIVIYIFVFFRPDDGLKYW